MIGVGHDNRKLFTAIAADKVGLAQALLEVQREALDHAVAHGVAVAVVDPFEVVKVEHRKAQGSIFTAGAEGAVFEQLQDVRVVKQAGQAVADHARF